MIIGINYVKQLILHLSMITEGKWMINTMIAVFNDIIPITVYRYVHTVLTVAVYRYIYTVYIDIHPIIMI